MSGSGSPKTRHHRETVAFQRAARQLATRVRTLRVSHSWTIEFTAESVGVEPAHVRRIEAAKANPTLAVLLSIAQAFSLTLSELLEDSSNSHRGPRRARPAR